MFFPCLTTKQWLFETVGSRWHVFQSKSLVGLRTVDIDCFGDGYLKDSVRRITAPFWLRMQQGGLSNITSGISEIRLPWGLNSTITVRPTCCWWRWQDEVTCAFDYLKRMNIKNKTQSKKECKSSLLLPCWNIMSVLKNFFFATKWIQARYWHYNPNFCYFLCEAVRRMSSWLPKVCVDRW